jgi:hypothetical protein
MKPPLEPTHRHNAVALEMPRLSDEAVIQIQDFLHHALDLFEDHYGQQIECFYKSLFDESPGAELDLGDSPF